MSDSEAPDEFSSKAPLKNFTDIKNNEEDENELNFDEDKFDEPLEEEEDNLNTETQVDGENDSDDDVLDEEEKQIENTDAETLESNADDESNSNTVVFEHFKYFNFIEC